MQNSSLEKSFLEAINRNFDGLKCSVQQTELGDGCTHGIFVTIPSENFLSENWVTIGNIVAIHYQKDLASSFDKWNIYLFYLVSEPKLISYDLRYNIENDTFSSRKIIESCDKAVEDLISEHILNRLNTFQPNLRRTSIKFEYNDILWGVLAKRNIKKNNIIPEEQMNAYKELVEKIKQQ